jgi:hypothetical protein
VLDEFHEVKKIFVDLNIRADFNFPKMHSMIHYTETIRRLGSADGYNTEAPERLHIEYAKDAYRASNKRDYIAQMTMWLRRQENIARFSAYLDWVVQTGPAASSTDDASGTDDDKEDDLPLVTGPHRRGKRGPYIRERRQGVRSVQSIAKHASASLAGIDIVIKHEAPDFIHALSSFLKKAGLPDSLLPTPLDLYDVFPQLVVHLPPMPETGNVESRDRVKAVPAKLASHSRTANPAQMSTVLVYRPESANPHTAGTFLQGECNKLGIAC